MFAGKFSTTPLDQATNGNGLFGVATSSDARGMIAWRNLNNSNPQVAKRASRNMDRTKLIKLMTEGSPPTVNAAADHVSFDADGQTINWTTADSTARQVIVLWLG